MKFAFMLKTYRGDIQRVIMLLESFHAFNVEKIQLYIVCPDEDKDLFNKFSCETVTVIEEESIGVDLLPKNSFLELETDSNKPSKLRAGYANQEIIKLAFYKLHLCENYLCLDSDCYFIREFHVSDFMYDEVTPYTILSKDSDLQSDPTYYETYWIEREKSIRKICTLIGYEHPTFRTSHGLSIFNCRVLEDFHDRFMKIHGLTYKGLIAISCYEFSWYNIYLQKTGIIPIISIEPVFKTFHTHKEYLLSLLSGVTNESLKKAYVGCVINSNWSGRIAKKPFKYGYYDKNILSLDFLSQQTQSTYAILARIFLYTTANKVVRILKKFFALCRK